MQHTRSCERGNAPYPASEGTHHILQCNTPDPASEGTHHILRARERTISCNATHQILRARERTRSCNATHQILRARERTISCEGTHCPATSLIPGGRGKFIVLKYDQPSCKLPTRASLTCGPHLRAHYLLHTAGGHKQLSACLFGFSLLLSGWSHLVVQPYSPSAPKRVVVNHLVFTEANPAAPIAQPGQGVAMRIVNGSIAIAGVDSTPVEQVWGMEERGVGRTFWHATWCMK